MGPLLPASDPRLSTFFTKGPLSPPSLPLPTLPLLHRYHYCYMPMPESLPLTLPWGRTRRRSIICGITAACHRSHHQPKLPPRPGMLSPSANGHRAKLAANRTNTLLSTSFCGSSRDKAQSECTTCSFLNLLKEFQSEIFEVLRFI